MSPQIVPTATRPRAGLLLFCLALAPSMAAGTADKDSVPAMMEILPKVAQGQPKALWQVTIKAQETDFIRFLSKDRILVATVETAGLGWGLEPREIIVLNALNGERIWAAPRKSFGFPQQLLATDPVILLQGTEKCAALNPRDGVLVWERACAGCGSLFLAEDDGIVLYSRKRATVSLTAVNIKDGSQRWSAAVGKYPEVKEVTLEARTMGQIVLLVGPEVSHSRPRRGRPSGGWPSQVNSARPPRHWCLGTTCTSRTARRSPASIQPPGTLCGARSSRARPCRACR